MSHKIQDLRNDLFDTLTLLKDDKIQLDKAKIICEVANAITNSVRVEIDFIKAINATHGTGFIELENKVSDAKVD